MDSAFDPVKNAANLVKHGVDLGFGARVFEDPASIVVPTIRIEDGEMRYRVIGRVDGKLFTAVHVVRDGIVRFISVRRSNSGEERTYYRA